MKYKLAQWVNSELVGCSNVAKSIDRDSTLISPRASKLCLGKWNASSKRESER